MPAVDSFVKRFDGGEPGSGRIHRRNIRRTTHGIDVYTCPVDVLRR